MKEIRVLQPERGRIWLPLEYGDTITKVAYPPLNGTHHECFHALKADKEVRAAKGLELALIIAGAYTGKDTEWQDIQKNCFASNYTRAPYRMLLIPAGCIEGDKGLAGVLVEEDLEGKGLSTNMEIPDLSKYQQRNNFYQLGNSVFVPSSTYEGKSFENDSIAHVHLTPEGAELSAKTVRDAGKTPYNWIAERMKNINKPEQRVSLLGEGSFGLCLCGDGWNDGDCRAFGVSVTGEARPQKI